MLLRSRIIVIVIAVVPTVAVIAPAVAGAAPGFTCEGNPSTYTVGAGDSWYGIAQRAAVSAGSLLAANGATADQALQPGDVLCLPAGAETTSSCTATAATYTVAPGDSWIGIATRAGVPSRSLLAANAAGAERALHPGDVLCLPPGARAPTSGSSSAGAGGRYTVASGDSWFGIATRAECRAARC